MNEKPHNCYDLLDWMGGKKYHCMECGKLFDFTEKEEVTPEE